MEITDFNIGQIVQSKSGKDQGKYFIVFAKLDEEHILIVDGSLRKVDQPKKKKMKHVAKVNSVSEETREAILNNKVVNDAFVRRELKKLGFNS